MSSEHSRSATEHVNKLIRFRQAVYDQFGPARDALFELTDAVIQMRQIQSFAELSCAPAFRRKWSSVYAAVQDGQPDRETLMHLYLQQFAPPVRLLLAGDHTVWPHLWTRTLEDVSYQHQPTPIVGRRPITLGHGYSTLAVIPEAHSSWALPLLHERIPNHKPVETAAQQLRQVCEQLTERPVTLWDSEYGCAEFLKLTADIPADKLLRLRTNLCLEGPARPPGPRGPHPKHGVRFKFQDPTTWWAPEEVVECSDPDFGATTVRLWSGLRFRQALDCRMCLAQVERPQAPGTRRKPKILWFAWVGATPPEHWWGFYAQRYALDHWYRFAKGRLHWTLPLFATPEAGERWSDLMPVLTWELWLAREVVADCPLPWQKPQARLAPGRVCQGMQNLLVTIGTPTRGCKSRGKSPGWPKGRQRTRRKCYEVVRSERWKTIRARQKAKKEGQGRNPGRPKQKKDAGTV